MKQLERIRDIDRKLDDMISHLEQVKRQHQLQKIQDTYFWGSLCIFSILALLLIL